MARGGFAATASGFDHGRHKMGLGPEVFRVDRPFCSHVVDDATDAVLFQPHRRSAIGDRASRGLCQGDARDFIFGSALPADDDPLSSMTAVRIGTS